MTLHENAWFLSGHEAPQADSPCFFQRQSAAAGSLPPPLLTARLVISHYFRK
jgi:hypothetical protein